MPRLPLPGAPALRSVRVGMESALSAPYPIGGDEMATTVGQIQWLNDFDRALNEAQTRHENVLLDFSAAPM